MTQPHHDPRQPHPIGARWWRVDRAQRVTPPPARPQQPQPTPMAAAAPTPHPPRNANDRHREALAQAGLNTRVAVWLTQNVGTMQCAYLFLAIGIGSLVGIFTGNTVLAAVCGSLSSYVLQLVLLPVLAVGQAVLSQHQEMQADEQYHATLRAVRDAEQVRGLLGDVLARLPASPPIPPGPATGAPAPATAPATPPRRSLPVVLAEQGQHTAHAHGHARARPAATPLDPTPRLRRRTEAKGARAG